MPHNFGYLNGSRQLPYLTTFERSNYRRQCRALTRRDAQILIYVDRDHLYDNRIVQDKAYRKVVRRCYNVLRKEMIEIDKCIRIRGG
jgi:hypothetical protein